MELPDWIQDTISNIGPGGLATTVVVFVLTLAFHYLRIAAANRQIRLLEGKLELLELETEGETKEQKRAELTTARQETERDLNQRNSELGVLEEKLSGLKERMSQNTAQVEQNRHQLKTLNDSQRTLREALVKDGEEVARVESRRVELIPIIERTRIAYAMIGKRLRELS